MFLSFAGADDLFSNSYISPNSAKDYETQEHSVFHGDKTSGPVVIQLDSSKDFSIKSSIKEEKRFARSVDPLVQTTAGLGDILTFKNVDDSLDSNDVEYSGRIAQFIQPSKTVNICLLKLLKLY